MRPADNYQFFLGALTRFRRTITLLAWYYNAKDSDPGGLPSTSMYAVLLSL